MRACAALLLCFTTLLSERARGDEAALLFEQGVSLIMQLQVDKAALQFETLLKRVPDYYPIAELPPKIMEPFLRARERYFASVQYKKLFYAKTLEARASKQSVHLKLEISTALLAHTKEILLHYKSDEHSVYRSVWFEPEPNFNGELDFELIPQTKGQIDYFVEFIGNYQRPFYSLASAYKPETLVIAKDPIPLHEPEPPQKFRAFKAGWPIAIGIVVTFLGTFTYGLLKIKR